MIPKIANKLIGATIEKVVSIEPEEDEINEVQIDEGAVYMKLSNGLYLKCWNSEWGGIAILQPKESHGGDSYKNDIKFIEDSKS